MPNPRALPEFIYCTHCVHIYVILFYIDSALAVQTKYKMVNILTLSFYPPHFPPPTSTPYRCCLTFCDSRPRKINDCPLRAPFCSSILSAARLGKKSGRGALLLFVKCVIYIGRSAHLMQLAISS